MGKSLSCEKRVRDWEWRGVMEKGSRDPRAPLGGFLERAEHSRPRPPTLQWTWGGLGPDALLTQQGQRELDDGQRNRESGQTYQ